MARRFLDVRVPQLGFATQNKYRTQIENHLLPAFGDMRMCDIDRPAVEEAFLTQKEQAGLGWWSRIDLKGVLSGIFTTAKSWKLWEGDNPTEGVRIGKKRLVREKRLLTADQLRGYSRGRWRSRKVCCPHPVRCGVANLGSAGTQVVRHRFRSR
jgi:hypothetical protein